MLSIAHATTGAFIASKIDNPLFSIPLILASHYLLDAIPHWDTGTGLTNGSKSRRLAFIHEIPDLLLAFLFIYLYFQLGKTITPTFAGLAPFWGGLVSLFPDFLEAPRNFLNRELKIISPLNRFHHSIHHSIPRVLDGLAPQILLMTMLYVLQ